MTAPAPSDLGLPASRFPSFRSEVRQWETVVELAGSATRFDLFQGSTGSGKSLIYTSLALFMGMRWCVLTGTKQLQDQNVDSFAAVGLVDVRGHGNYPCAVHDRSPYEPVCSLPRLCCHWQADVDRARAARGVVTNYAFWMAGGGMLGDFDLLVCDEAHSLLGWLTDAVSVTVRPHDLARLAGFSLPDLELGLDPAFRFVPWAEEALAAAKERRRGLRQPRPDDREAQRELAHLDGLIKDLARLAGSPRSGTPWVIDREDEAGMPRDTGRPGLVFKPVWPAAYAEEYLFRGIPKVLLTSATLSPSVGRHLGIPAGDSSWHEVESGFDPRRRPVWYYPVAKMEYAMPEVGLAKAVTAGDLFMGSRIADRKGLIQTPSYDWCERVASRSRFTPWFMRHGRGQHADAIDRFTRAEPPAALLTPAVKEGWDGRDDRARWSWVPKVPLLNRKIPLTKARCALDPTWHDIEVATAIMQWVGRLVRSASDWGEVLITDEHAGRLFAKKGLWPRGFLAAVRRVKELPERIEFPRI